MAILKKIKGKRIVYDAKTKKQREETFYFTPEPEPKEELELLNIQDAIKLVKYAKKQGWI